MKTTLTIALSVAALAFGVGCTTVVKEDTTPDVIQKTTSYERKTSTYPGSAGYSSEQTTTTTTLD